MSNKLDKWLTKTGYLIIIEPVEKGEIIANETIKDNGFVLTVMTDAKADMGVMLFGPTIREVIMYLESMHTKIRMPD